MWKTTERQRKLFFAKWNYKLLYLRKGWSSHSWSAWCHSAVHWLKWHWVSRVQYHPFWTSSHLERFVCYGHPKTMFSARPSRQEICGMNKFSDFQRGKSDWWKSGGSWMHFPSHFLGCCTKNLHPRETKQIHFCSFSGQIYTSKSDLHHSVSPDILVHLATVKAHLKCDVDLTGGPRPTSEHGSRFSSELWYN